MGTGNLRKHMRSRHGVTGPDVNKCMKCGSEEHGERIGDYIRHVKDCKGGT